MLVDVHVQLFQIDDENHHHVDEVFLLIVFEFQLNDYFHLKVSFHLFDMFQMLDEFYYQVQLLNQIFPSIYDLEH
jgi:hypothetical protein